MSQQDNDIWIFVEEKLKATVPAYFKHVLQVCGYNNGISISEIEEEDIKYIEAEVRNGNVGKAFNGSDVNFLEGCSKSPDNFEFVLGHKKFLMAIVGFLKKHLAQNGLDSFRLNRKPSNTKKIEEEILVLLSRKDADELVPLMKNAMKLDACTKTKTSSDLGCANDSQLSYNKKDLEIKDQDQASFNENCLKLQPNCPLEKLLIVDQKMLRSHTGFGEISTENSPIDEISMKNGSYVVYQMSLKSWIRWPSAEPHVKYFVGQVHFSGGSDGNKLNSEIELIVLRNNLNKIRNFSYPLGYPGNFETTKVPKKSILQILQNPTTNRRGELVFDDKSLLNYTFD